MVDLGLSSLNLISLAAYTAFFCLGLFIWFRVNRASIRANRQIALLEAILEQEKRQTALLKRLYEASGHKNVEPKVTLAAEQEDEFMRLVAER